MSLSEYLEKQRRLQKSDDDAAQLNAPNHASASAGHLGAIASQPLEKGSEPCVVFCQWNRRRLVLPWSYFVEAEYFPSDNVAPGTSTASFAEQIQMTFGSREIVMRGRNLVALADAIMKHRIVEIREVPERFLHADAADGEPLIVHMEIRKREK